MLLSNKQKAFINDSGAHRWAIKHGATRSGKTYLDYYIIPWRVRERAGKEGLNVLLGNTRGTLQRNVIDPMQAIFGSACVSDIHADNTATIFGERVYCLGADSIKHVDRLRGASVKYCYGDEIVTWNSEVFEMLKSRLDKPYSHFDGTCNPAGQDHWLKKFIDSDADVYSQTYSIDDNPFLDAKVREAIKSEHKGVFYDRYILGLWAKAEGLVYPMFDRAAHVTPSVQRNYTRYVLSCDYGIQNPFSAGLWGLCGGVWYRVREYYHSGRETNEQKTDQQYYDALCAFVGDAPIERIIIDPSATSFIALCRQQHRFQVRNARNDVIDGIQATATALNKGLIKINDCCVRTIEEFGLYSWDSKSQEDKVLKEHDHAMDDTRYFVFTMRIGRDAGQGSTGYSLF